MSDGSGYADLIILALLAVFILLRLRSVLGDKVGHDSPNYFNKIIPSSAPKQEPIVQIDERHLKAKPLDEDPYLAKISDPYVVETIEKIKEKDPQFTITAFMQGAKMAYEMVFDAFAKGDRKTLGMLLSDDIMATFAKELDARESSDNKTETTLVSVKAKEVGSASLQGNIARLTIHFDSEQVIVVRNQKGEIQEGDPSQLHDVEDSWVFERNVTSKNPNWKIIET